ncbi:MAG TPA: PBP1A family penicillin-binding protein [Oculatellaceae cyanobacterium]|jgi:penicillin-binding protein 1A
MRLLRPLASIVIAGTLLLGLSGCLGTPSVDKVLKEGINPTRWTQVLASDGTPILSFGKFHHKNVALEEVSPAFIDALLATEDRRFYSHHGVDPVAIARAIVRDVTHKGFREGGSTITQQLARNVFLSNERSISRKLKEAFLAIELENKLSKKQILELYVNNIYFGEGAYGIKAASEIYFGKPPSKLTIPEAALIAGLPQAPSGYSPFQNMQAAKARRDEVLDNLREVGKLSAEECENYKKRPIRVNMAGRTIASSNKAPFFNRYVMEQVMRHFSLDEQSFWQSGLKIYTTLDMRAQTLADEVLRQGSALYGRTRATQQAALLSIDPRTGAILAYVGGKDYGKSQFDRVTQAIRSPGSLFKIFTYTTAIDQGYEPTRVYLDEPIKIGDWQPQNYDKSHHGYMTIARALMTSNNIVAVKVINELGPDAVIRMARQMGIRSPLEAYLGLTLGGSGVNLMEITSAFGVLANRGVRVEPYAIEKIVDDGGRRIYGEHPVRLDVLNRTTVDTMVKMMQAVVTHGTGQAANIGRPMAGKTGTSDDYRDAWFVGFTPNVVTGVWVGNDNNTPMPGMTGGSLPAVIWRNYMKPYLASKPVETFDLAFSKPLRDEDFITYDLKNLSDKEKNSHLAIPEAKEGELQQDPLIDPNADLPATGVPEGGGEAGSMPPSPEAPVPTPVQQPLPGYGGPTSSAPVPPSRQNVNVVPPERRKTRIDPAAETPSALIPLPKEGY